MYSYKRPGGELFEKRGSATITDKKTTLESGGNGWLIDTLHFILQIKTAMSCFDFFVSC